MPWPSRAEQANETFGDEVDVRLVAIDLTVRDRKGRLVEGLTIDDLEVFEDGEPMELVALERPPAGAELFSGLLEGRAKKREGARSPAAPDTSGEEATRLVVLAMDRGALAGVQPRQIQANLRQLLLRPDAQNARWMAVAWDGRSVQVVAPPGTSPGVIAERLQGIVEPLAGAVNSAQLRSNGMRRIADSYERINTLPAPALALLAGEEPAVGETPEGQRNVNPCDVDWRGLVDEAREYTVASRQAALRRFAVLEEMISTIGAFGEPSTVVFLSDGLVRRPGVDAYHFVEELCPDQAMDIRRLVQVEDLTVQLQRVAALANSLRMTLLPIDGGGKRTNENASAELDFARLVPSVVNQRLHLDSVQSSLALLASETGGRAVLDTDQIGLPLAEALRAARPRYLLTVRPSHPRSGRRHSLLVLPREYRGWKLEYRRSYLDRTLTQVLADQLRNVTVHGLQPPASEASFGSVRVEVSSATSQGGTCSISIRVHGAVQVLLAGVRTLSKVRIWVYGVNSSQELPPRQRLIETSPDGAFELAIDVPLEGRQCRSRDWRIGVGVRDELGGAAHYVVSDLVEIGASGEPL